MNIIVPIIKFIFSFRNIYKCTMLISTIKNEWLLIITIIL